MSTPSKDFLPSLVGSMSVGAAGNPTVEMIEAAFAHHGLHYRYVNMEVTPEILARLLLERPPWALSVSTAAFRTR